jgi:hypothetical protein
LPAAGGFLIATHALEKTTDDSPSSDKPPMAFLHPAHDSVGVLLHLARQRFFDDVASGGHCVYLLAPRIVKH